MRTSRGVLSNQTKKEKKNETRACDSYPVLGTYSATSFRDKKLGSFLEHYSKARDLLFKWFPFRNGAGGVLLGLLDCEGRRNGVFWGVLGECRVSKAE